MSLENPVESIKKDLYVRLAFSLFGYLVGSAYKEGQHQIICKSVSFVVSEEGDFYILSKIGDHLKSLVLSNDVLMTILKEGKSVSDMWDIQVKGTLEYVDDESSFLLAQNLFKEKSPYLASVAFLEMGSKYSLLKLQVKEIHCQNLSDERVDKNIFILKK